MKLHLLFSYIALLSIGITPPAVAKPGFFEQTNQPLVLSSKIPRISDIKRPLTSVEGLAQKPTPIEADESEVLQVKGVRLNPTPSGIEVILNTLAGQKLQANTRISGNTLIADIPNTQLALPEGREFRAENPSEGITLVTVTQLDANNIRVSVTGIAAAPTAQLVPSASSLILSLTPAAEEEEEIEIVVTGEQETDYLVPDATTATKIPVPLRDIPQSIQVIPRQVIEDRQVVRLNELTDNVSGVQRVPGYGCLSSLGVRIRGFTSQFETLRNGFRDFDYLSPREVANVERVEVLKGPASVLYGLI